MWTCPSHSGLPPRLLPMTRCCVTNSPDFDEAKQPPLLCHHGFWIIRARCSCDACLCSEVFDPQLGRPEQLGVEPSGTFHSCVWCSDWGDLQVRLRGAIGQDVCMRMVTWGCQILYLAAQDEQRSYMASDEPEITWHHFYRTWLK